MEYPPGCYLYSNFIDQNYEKQLLGNLDIILFLYQATTKLLFNKLGLGMLAGNTTFKNIKKSYIFKMNERILCQA